MVRETHLPTRDVPWSFSTTTTPPLPMFAMFLSTTRAKESKSREELAAMLSKASITELAEVTILLFPRESTKQWMILVY